MDTRSQALLNFIVGECRLTGVKMKLEEAREVDQGDGLPCAGYFDDQTKTLAVARLGRKWFEVLIHEFCHMQQWLDKSPAWTNTSKYPWYFDWVAGQVKKPRTLTDAASRRQLEVELDCEKRAVQKIRTWDLPIDTKRYIQEANAYVLYYTFIRYNGVWYGRSPCGISAIVSDMPSHFMPRAWYETMSNEYAYQVFRHCLSPKQQRLAWTRLAA